MVNIVATEIPEVKVLTPVRHEDARGFLSEAWNQRSLTAAGIDPPFVQDNLAYSEQARTLRGLHFQRPPHAQGKLVFVLQGSVIDVAVDLRREAPTFGRHVAVTLSAEEGNQIWIPPGFAHGYCTLEDRTLVYYKQTDFYAPQCEGGIRWDDPTLGIAWPVTAATVKLSDKDRRLPSFDDWQTSR